MQAGELMQDYKTGHLLGASPRGQFFGQLVGSTAGIVVASAAYKVRAGGYRTRLIIMVGSMDQSLTLLFQCGCKAL